jgi:hypothetical protein
MLMRRMLLAIIAPALLLGCSSTRSVRVAVPPKVDLRPYPVVGLVVFSSNANHDFEQLATQKFLQQIQSAQPGTRVVELGNEADVLKSVGHHSWDVATFKAVKEKHGVDVIAMGRVDMTKAKPQAQVSLSNMFKAVNVRQDVTAALTARLIESSSGATMWTESSKQTANVANADFSNHGGGVGMRDTEATYGAMIENLACQITDDFRTHYVIRQVPKDQAVQTASAGE